ncbi:MAG: hypothetical protein Unbinned3459contig1000_41 [Prokaryotic dsDNA virus sp.]|jgi:hypothetical protein|nr:MAG: hypothetical protein Unbinned3459contig1000_41 [Prokaryotic dsDNA virus sp.]|tara:strand:- start:2151 stop:2390 length:240 start_codon:yes stop_codon:yes gene_type:complete
MITTQHLDQTLDRMETYGGGFVKGLAALYRRSDLRNQQKILTTWPELFEEYGPNGIFASKATDIKSMGYTMVKHLTVRK